MNQLNLDFNQAHARREHPVQSHEAADRKTKSQTLPNDRLRVLKAVAMNQGRTAKQLDAMYHLDGKAHRRCKELEDIDYIYRDTSGREMKCYLAGKGRIFLINQEKE